MCNVKPLDALEIKREFIKMVHFSLTNTPVSERGAVGQRAGLAPGLIGYSIWCIKKLRQTPLWRKNWPWETLELEKV